MTHPTGPGAQDQCATCARTRAEHNDPTTAGLCVEFVEIPWPTRMARFVEAAQKVAASIATMRHALQEGMRATTELYGAMQLAGLIPEESEQEPGRHHRAAPACPLDGEPLAEVTAARNAPTAYRHTDGTTHLDRLPEIANLPPGWSVAPEPTDMEVTHAIPAYRDEKPEHDWTCKNCGDHSWVGWRAGPAHEGFPRKAQCVPCGHVQDLPAQPEDTPTQ